MILHRLLWIFFSFLPLMSFAGKYVHYCVGSTGGCHRVPVEFVLKYPDSTLARPVLHPEEISSDDYKEINGERFYFVDGVNSETFSHIVNWLDSKKPEEIPKKMIGLAKTAAIKLLLPELLESLSKNSDPNKIYFYLKQQDKITSISKTKYLDVWGQADTFLKTAMAGRFSRDGSSEDSAIEVSMDPWLFKTYGIRLLEKGEVVVDKTEAEEVLAEMQDYLQLPLVRIYRDHQVHIKYGQRVKSAYQCPNGYVLVFRDKPVRDFQVSVPFCVMQYLASSNESHVAISSIRGQPWVMLDQQRAKEACEANGPGYHLLTMDEWMIIAAAIEENLKNWSEVHEGIPTGKLPAGWNSKAPIPEPSENQEITDWNTKRSFHLNNGFFGEATIWDFAGTTFQWIDGAYWFHEITKRPIKYHERISAMMDQYGPIGHYDVDHNFGDFEFFAVKQPAAVARGGGAYYSKSGIYSFLGTYNTSTRDNIGFRCAYSFE